MRRSTRRAWSHPNALWCLSQRVRATGFLERQRPCRVVDEEQAFQVLEDIAAGAWPEASTRLARALSADPADAEALELQAYLEEASSGDLPFLEPEGTESRPTRVPDPLALMCLLCGSPCEDGGTVLLNTRFASFMGWDVANQSAHVVVCPDCLYVHWFVPSAPGTFQALGRDDARAALRPANGGFSCQVCTYDSAAEVQRQVNTRGLTFLGLDWLNRTAKARACNRCGYLHWGPGPWAGRVDPPGVEAGIRCMCCGSGAWEKRKALLNSRAMTLLGLDWIDEGAQIWSCRECQALHWFRAEPLAAD